MYLYELVCTGRYQYIVSYQRIYQYVLVHTGIYSYILDYDLTTSGFRGLHRDEAMLQTGPAQASTASEEGEGDHNPCEEDE